MAIHVIVFETSDDVTVEQLHEALCKACHEGSTDEVASMVQNIRTLPDVLTDGMKSE